MHLEKTTQSDEFGIINEINTVFELIRSDNTVAKSYVETHENVEFWKRTIIRNFFANTEVQLFQMRRILLELQSMTDRGLSHFEIDWLKNVRYVVENGEIKSEVAKTNLADTVLLTLKLFAKVFGFECQIDTGKDRGWSDFRKAIKIRDRLMHPKTLNDLEIKDYEEVVIESAIEWIEKIVVIAVENAKARMAGR